MSLPCRVTTTKPRAALEHVALATYLTHCLPSTSYRPRLARRFKVKLALDIALMLDTELTLSAISAWP